ncbi:MAG: hypothetical protein IJK60_05450 [Clostridia bacterium]|nr:hypothetical protein [Clostridia bacterium]
MSEKTLEKIRDMLCYELDDVVEGNQFSIGMLDSIDKIVHTIKNIDRIMESEGGYSMNGDYSRDNYSRNGGYSREGGYSRDNYSNGNSYRRDSMGRYARRYSRDGAEVKSRLEEMMNEAENDKEREAIRKAVTMLENN